MLNLFAKSWRNTIFARLFLTYLVVILPLIAMGMFLYEWSYQNASQDISRSSLAQLSYYLDDLNREIEWLEIQQFDLLEDSNLNKLAVTWNLMDNVDRREGVNYLLNRLTSIKNSSPYIKDISVHLPSIGKTVSAVRDISDLDRVQYDYFRTDPDTNGERLIWWNQALHLSAAKQIGKKGRAPLFIVQIELNMDKLKESLQQINLYPDSGSLMVSASSPFLLGSGPSLSPVMREAVKKNPGRATFSLDINGQRFHVDKVYSDKLGLAVATYLPEAAVKKPLNKFVRWAWLFATTSLLAIVLYAISTYRFVQKPLLLLIRRFKIMEGGALDIPIEHELRDEFGYLYNRFNLMLEKLQALIDQDFKQKLMMQRAELKQLQSQINPHFLYNSFFILNSLAKTGDTERIQLFTKMLGEYFRFITRNDQDNVPLSEEVKHSRIYTDIQQLRFSRRIRAQFEELPEEMASIRVPRLILQPIIENAYEHSLEKMPDEGRLRISFEWDPEEARIRVEDNGQEIGDDGIRDLQDRLRGYAESGEMTGMINIHRRIVLTYGQGSGLILSRSEFGGLRVDIRIKGKEGDRLVPIADRG